MEILWRSQLGMLLSWLQAVIVEADRMPARFGNLGSLRVLSDLNAG